MEATSLWNGEGTGENWGKGIICFRAWKLACLRDTGVHAQTNVVKWIWQRQVTWDFCFPTICKSYVYAILWSVQCSIFHFFNFSFAFTAWWTGIRALAFSPYQPLTCLPHGIIFSLWFNVKGMQYFCLLKHLNTIIGSKFQKFVF